MMTNPRSGLVLLLSYAALLVPACDKRPAPSYGDVNSGASSGPSDANAKATPATRSDVERRAPGDAAKPADPTSSPTANGANRRPKRTPDPPTMAAPVYSTWRHAMRQRWSLAGLDGATPVGDLAAVDEGTVLVATSDKLHLIAVEDGKILGSVSLNGRLVDGPRRFGDMFWILATGGKLVGYDVAKPTAGPRTELLLAGKQRRIVGFTSTAVITVRKGAKRSYELAAYKLKPNAKRPIEPVWARTPNVAAGWQWLVRLAGKSLVLPDARRIVGLDTASGRVRWMWRTRSQPVPGVLHDGHYELGHKGKLVQLLARNGKVAKSIALPKAPTSEFAAAGTRRYYGSKAKTIAVDIATKKLIWAADTPSAGAPMVGEQWLWTFSGDTVTALNKKSGKAVCSWSGYKGTKPTLVGDALVYIESQTRRLIGIGCDPAPVAVPAGPCRHLQKCCGAFAPTEPALAKACAKVLSRILDLGLNRECRKALVTYAKDQNAPAICREPPPPPAKK